VGAGVGHIVVDSFEEIARLAYLTEGAGPAAETGHTARTGASVEAAAPGPSRYAPANRGRPKILVRVTTGVEAHTHEFVATAHDDQKFGFALSSGAADEAVRRGVGPPGAGLARLHSHIGSPSYDTAGVVGGGAPAGGVGG